MADKINKKMIEDTISECRLDQECAKEVDLKQCIESSRCDDPEFCRAYDGLRQARLIARELIRLRQTKGLSRADLAKAADCSLSAISRLENPNETRKNLALLHRVVAAMGFQLKIEIVPGTGRE